MADYAALADKKQELIRKGLEGSVFVAKPTAAAITRANLFTAGGALVGTRPAGYDDLGWLTEDGAQFSRSVDTSEMTGWGSTDPLRSDITSDTTTLAVTCLETKLITLGLGLGIDVDAAAADANGTVELRKPSKPGANYYRVLSLAVDLADEGEVYIARFLPRAKVTDYSDQSLNNGDDGITWGVTFTSYRDSAFGSSESYLFGGPGWFAMLEAMGFDPAPTTPAPTTPAPTTPAPSGS